MIVISDHLTCYNLCVIIHSPLPTITWSRIVQGDNSLSVDNVVVNDEAFLLTVVNVRLADVGDYICNASNGVGQLVATLKIRGEIFC